MKGQNTTPQLHCSWTEVTTLGLTWTTKNVQSSYMCATPTDNDDEETMRMK